MLKEVVIANKGYVIYETEENEQIDEIAVQVVRQECPDFLLPFRTICIDGKQEFRYELTDGIRMSYQPQRMSKKEFIQQMIRMLLPFKDCSDWLLDYHFLCLDPRYILVNGKDQMVRYLYIPVLGHEESDKRIMEFFRDFSIRTELSDDKDFILKLLRILQDTNSNLMTVLKFLQQEKESFSAVSHTAVHSEKRYVEQEEVKKEKNPENAEEKVEAKKDAQKSEERFGQLNLEGELLNSLYGSDTPKKKGLLGLFAGKKKQKGKESEEQKKSSAVNTQINKKQRDLKDISNGNRETQKVYAEPEITEMDDVSEYENDVPVIRLRLENSGNYVVPSNIELNLEKGHITVGRYDKYGVPCADFNFDHSLTIISRIHFRMELRPDGYKIIDLNSKNGTLLNGQELMPNIAYELHSGDIIALARQTRITYRVM